MFSSSFAFFDVLSHPKRTHSSLRGQLQLQLLFLAEIINNYSRTPQLVGSFEALRFIEAEEKGKIRQKKAKEEKN